MDEMMVGVPPPPKVKAVEGARLRADTMIEIPTRLERGEKVNKRIAWELGVDHTIMKRRRRLGGKG